jgi:ABC-type multidrug transport system fused ATPase/permease subunit
LGIDPGFGSNYLLFRSRDVIWHHISQEPDLFKDTVANNIAYGARKYHDVVPVTQEMIEAAARKANAHDFIMELPLGMWIIAITRHLLPYM